jgi:hypothetical protein
MMARDTRTADPGSQLSRFRETARQLGADENGTAFKSKSIIIAMLPSQHFGGIGNVKPANQDEPRLNRCFTNNRSGNRRQVVVRRVLAAAG